MSTFKIPDEAVRIYVDRPLTPEEKVDGKFVQGTAPGPDLVNPEIVEHEHRRDLDTGEGIICIAVRPGETLGELYVNVQFEGQIGKYEDCMAGHNRLLLQASDWLRGALEQLLPQDATVDVELVASPCPDAKTRPPVENAALTILEGRIVYTTSTTNVSRNVNTSTLRNQQEQQP